MTCTTSDRLSLAYNADHCMDVIISAGVRRQVRYPSPLSRPHPDPTVTPTQVILSDTQWTKSGRLAGYSCTR